MERSLSVPNFHPPMYYLRLMSTDDPAGPDTAAQELPPPSACMHVAVDMRACKRVRACACVQTLIRGAYTRTQAWSCMSRST